MVPEIKHKLADAIHDYNQDADFLLKKLAEEASELVTISLQILNKPDERTREMWGNLFEEIAHVELRLELFQRAVVSTDNHHIRVEKDRKIKKYEKKLAEGIVKNI